MTGLRFYWTWRYWGFRLIPGPTRHEFQWGLHVGPLLLHRWKHLPGPRLATRNANHDQPKRGQA